MPQLRALYARLRHATEGQATIYLAVANTSIHRRLTMPPESTRLADVVRATRKRIADGGESSRPQGAMVDYADLEAVFDFYERIALRLQSEQSVTIAPRTGRAIAIGDLLEEGVRVA